MPRVKSDTERGPIGTWLRHERNARQWSPEDVVAVLRERGHGIRVDYYRGLEAGRRPGPELLEVFAILYGSRPPEVVVDATQPDGFRLIAEAIDRQTLLLQRILLVLGGQAQSPEIARIAAALAEAERADAESAMGQVGVHAIEGLSPARPETRTR